MRTHVVIGAMLCLASCHHPSQTATEASERTVDIDSLVRVYFEHFNAHDWQALAGMYTDTALMLDPSTGPEAVPFSRADIVDKYNGLSEQIPDVRDSVVAVRPGLGSVTVEFVSTGTAPDSTRFRLPICTVFVLRDGLIAEDRTYYDN